MWSNGKWHGQGKIVNIQGVIYEGELYNGRRHGKGTMINTNNEKLICTFTMDKLNGIGEYIMTDGNMIHVEYKNG